MVFSLFEICLAIIVSQGIFLALALQLVPKKNKDANRILSLILLIASLICLGRVLVFKYHNMSIVRIGTLLDATIFIFGPLLYLYFRRLLFKDNTVYKLAFSHYIILCLFTIYAIWTFTLDRAGLKENYDNGTLPIIYIIIELTGLLSIAFYSYKIKLLLKAYKKYESSQIAYDQSIVNYIKWVLFSVSIFLTLWLFSFISYYCFNYYNAIFNYNTMWLSASLFMYFVGFYGLAQPKIFRIPIKVMSKKTTKARMSKNEIADLKKNLQIAMTKDLLYLKPDLSLAMLATYNNTSTNNLSWYLNKVENKTFYHFVNEYRVQAFLEKVKANEHKTKTLIAMAFEVGFNTKSTFINAFKTILNETPAQYIKKSEGVQKAFQ